MRTAPTRSSARPRLRNWLLGLAALLATAQAPAADAPRLVVLDVGEGLAILLAHEEHGVLIDTGRVGMGRHVLDRLAHHGVTRLDAVIYTHMHPDHVGSWFRIHEAFPDVQVIESGHRIEGTGWPDTSRWAADALDALPDEQHRIVRRGDQWTWRGVKIEVLWPEDPAGGGLNEQSIALHLSHGEADALLMGDVNKKVERVLLDDGAIPADVDVLVAGHHGSKHTSSTALLERADPRYAVISTDANNIRGYPHPATVKRLQSAADELRRTWVDGESCYMLGERPRRVSCAREP